MTDADPNKTLIPTLTRDGSQYARAVRQNLINSDFIAAGKLITARAQANMVATENLTVQVMIGYRG